MLDTKHTYTDLESLHVELCDEANIVVHHIRNGMHAEREARALRDLITQDLPRTIRQVERETEAAVLADIERLARAVQAAPPAVPAPDVPAGATMNDEPLHTPTEHAEHLLVLLDDLGIADMVRDAQPTLDTACFDLTESHDPKVRALGYTLGLTAVLETPGALEQAVRALRARLAEGLPVVG